MNRCKTCTHWTAPNGSDTYKLPWRADAICQPRDPDTDELMQRGFETRICLQPNQARFEPPVQRDGFALNDGSGYMVMLATAEDFGCVLHQEASS